MTAPPAAPRDVLMRELAKHWGVQPVGSMVGGFADRLLAALAAAGLAVVPVVATDGMLEAGWAHTGDPCWKENVAQAWAVMVAAAQERE